MDIELCGELLRRYAVYSRSSCFNRSVTGFLPSIAQLSFRQKLNRARERLSALLQRENACSLRRRIEQLVPLSLFELAPTYRQRRICWLLELCSCPAFARHARHLTDHRLEVKIAPDGNAHGEPKNKNKP